MGASGERGAVMKMGRWLGIDGLDGGKAGYYTYKPEDPMYPRYMVCRVRVRGMRDVAKRNGTRLSLILTSFDLQFVLLEVFETTPFN